MSASAMIVAWEAQLPAELKFLLLALAWISQDDVPPFRAFPSQAYLAERMGCKPRSIRDRLARLESAGIITRGGKTSHGVVVYQFTPANIAARQILPPGKYCLPPRQILPTTPALNAAQVGIKCLQNKYVISNEEEREEAETRHSKMTSMAEAEAEAGPPPPLPPPPPNVFADPHTDPLVLAHRWRETLHTVRERRRGSFTPAQLDTLLRGSRLVELAHGRALISATSIANRDALRVQFASDFERCLGCPVEIIVATPAAPSAAGQPSRQEITA